MVCGKSRDLGSESFHHLSTEALVIYISFLSLSDSVCKMEIIIAASEVFFVCVCEEIFKGSRTVML